MRTAIVLITLGVGVTAWYFNNPFAWGMLAGAALATAAFELERIKARRQHQSESTEEDRDFEVLMAMVKKHSIPGSRASQSLLRYMPIRARVAEAKETLRAYRALELEPEPPGPEFDYVDDGILVSPDTRGWPKK